MTQYTSVAQIRSDVVMYHPGLVEGITKRRLQNISDAKECGQCVCTVTDTSS